MTPSTIEEQLTKYLTDAHSIEQQALAQMKLAPKLAGDEQIALVFREHLRETEDHERLITGRLEAHGAKPSKVKDIAGLVTGAGFGAFAMAQPDTPGKLVVHAFSYEHMEEAAYDLLGRVAERASDPETQEVAQRIEEQERTMGDRVAGCFDRAAELSLAKVPRNDLRKQLTKYLADAHAIEGQSLKLLEKSAKVVGDPQVAAAFNQHRVETERHQQIVGGLIGAHGASASPLKDAALRLGALNWGAFFAVQPDTPVKLAGFAYALEHLEIGAYQMLRRVAERAGDIQAVQSVEQILAEEQAAAERIRGLFGQALEATLGARSLTTG